MTTIVIMHWHHCKARRIFLSDAAEPTARQAEGMTMKTLPLVVLLTAGAFLMTRPNAAEADGAETEMSARGTGSAPRDRYAIGLERLKAIDGRDGQQVIESLAAVAPDFARYLVEFPFGDIYARPGLDLRAREIATIAALTAMGTARPQLEVHVAAGLKVGLTRTEIIEVIMQMSVYAGFPAAINGLQAAQTVFGRHPEADVGTRSETSAPR